jgi:hypothetical protein
MIMVEFFTSQDEACRMAADAMHNAAVERAMYSTKKPLFLSAASVP